MKARVVVDLEVGESPAGDAITYFIARDGVALADEARSLSEWVEAVICSCVDDTVRQPCYGLGWRILSCRSALV